MLLEINYENENLIVDESQLDGYPGCRIIRRHDEMPPDNPFGQVSGEHLQSVHLQKAIESVLILSGYKLTCGLLFDESQALEIDITELAKKVLANRTSEREFEVGRRKFKSSP